MSRNSNGIAMTTIHAPWVNFVTRTITRTVPVMQKPTPLTRRLRFMRPRSAGSRSSIRCRFQCLIIPSWLSVNDTKTPMMYSWISAETLAS